MSTGGSAGASVRASAPGKLVLLGEYAVLEGAPALVAAIDRRAYATLTPDNSDELRVRAPQLEAETQLTRDVTGAFVAQQNAPPSLALALRLITAAQHQGAAPLPGGTLTLDSAAFYHGADKLGLGSSAAIATALGQVLGVATSAPFVQSPQTLFDWVHPLHQAQQQGRGSGIDIAASSFGGYLRFEGERAAPPPTDPSCDAQAVAAALEGRSREALRERKLGIAIHPIAPLDDLAIQVTYTGRSAATPAFLAAFEALRCEQPQAFWPMLEELAALSHGGVEMWTLGAREPLLEIVRRYHEALRELGQMLKQDVVTLEHERLMRAAKRVGAAYKPSGAGGGDVGIALGAPGLRAWWLRRALRRAGGQVLRVALGAPGVRRET